MFVKHTFTFYRSKNFNAKHTRKFFILDHSILTGKMINGRIVPSSKKNSGKSGTGRGRNNIPLLVSRRFFIY
jgi:hypothetical protein